MEAQEHASATAAWVAGTATVHAGSSTADRPPESSPAAAAPDSSRGDAALLPGAELGASGAEVAASQSHADLGFHKSDAVDADKQQVRLHLLFWEDCVGSPPWYQVDFCLIAACHRHRTNAASAPRHHISACSSRLHECLNCCTPFRAGC